MHQNSPVFSRLSACVRLWQWLFRAELQRWLSNDASHLRHQRERPIFVVLEERHPFFGPVLVPVDQVRCVRNLTPLLSSSSFAEGTSGTRRYRMDSESPVSPSFSVC